jgi:hypothetical protein
MSTSEDSMTKHLGEFSMGKYPTRDGPFNRPHAVGIDGSQLSVKYTFYRRRSCEWSFDVACMSLRVRREVTAA